MDWFMLRFQEMLTLKLFKKNKLNPEVDGTLFPFSCLNILCMNLHVMNFWFKERYFGINNNSPFYRNKKNVMQNIHTIIATEARCSPF